MVLTYDSSGILQAMQNKWAVDSANDPYAKIGNAAGAGIARGYETANKSAIEEVANQKKSTADFVNKILETNVPAMVVDQTKPINDPDRYRMIPVDQQMQVRDSILKQKPLPANIALVPTRIFSPEKPATEYEQGKIYGYDAVTGEKKLMGTEERIRGAGDKFIKLENESDRVAKKQGDSLNIFTQEVARIRQGYDQLKDSSEAAGGWNEKDALLYKTKISNLQKAMELATAYPDRIEEAKQMLSKDYEITGEPEKKETVTKWGKLDILGLKPNEEVITPSTLKVVEKQAQPAKIGADIKKTTATTPPFKGTVTNQKATSPNGDVFIWDGTKWIQQ